MKTVVSVLLALFLVACGSGGDKRVAALEDQDGDSIADAQDDCGQTADGSVVGETGCALFYGPIQNLAFQPGDHRLDGNSRIALDKLIAELAKHPEVSISLGGHTDNRGSAKANLELSKKRVISVVRYLVSNGVKGTRIKPYGFGESQPIVSNATLEGRIRNRRIEVDVIEQ
ncbi:MAG: OmpA family protein [Granulosicoccaceae bacterium]